MSTILTKFLSLLADGWRIEEIQLKYESVPFEIQQDIVRLSKESCTQVIEATNDPEFSEHIGHYRTLPNISTGEILFTYVEDISKYCELEERFFSFTCGVEPYLDALQPQSPLSNMDRKRVAAAVETWIQSERSFTRFPTRFPRIFSDMLVLFSNQGKVDCKIIEKDTCDIAEAPKSFLPERSVDWAYAFSSVFLSPKVTNQFNRDAVVVVGIYDLVKRRIAAACVGTIRSILNYAGHPFTRGRELLEIVEDFRERILADGAWKVMIVAPFRNAEFTPVPWIMHALLCDELPEEGGRLPRLRPSELILFADSGIHRDRSSLDFKREPQTAAVMLEARIKNRKHLWNLRFDRSPGEAKFHVDLEVFDTSTGTSQKLISHAPVLLRDMWQLSENLYLAFITAGAFDVKFDEMVTKDIKGFNELLEREPLAVYPLIYRGLIEPTERWLAANSAALSLLRKYWDDPEYSATEDEHALVESLEQKNLIESGGLTNKAIWILNRVVSLARRRGSEVSHGDWAASR
jgi:hypothetical protein